MLPSDFPVWQSCYAYWQKWSEKPEDASGLLEEALKNVVAVIRRDHGRDAQTGFLIIDSQSVKNTDTAGRKGYDAGRKVSGIKRHIGVDTNGLPHAVHITTADITDRNGALEAFRLCKDNLTKGVAVLADGSYAGEPFATGVYETPGATVEVVKRNNLHKFVVLPRHRVVERSFGWLERCRRLWKNYERKINTSLPMIVPSFLAYTEKKDHKYALTNRHRNRLKGA
jgi:transposase